MQKIEVGSHNQQMKTRNRPQQHKNKDGNETKVNALIEQ